MPQSVILGSSKLNKTLLSPHNRNVSHPPALPSSYVQRATLTLDNQGLHSSPVEQLTPYGAPTGLDPKVGKDFIADQPFLYALFDSETLTCIVVSAFSVPTYRR